MVCFIILFSLLYRVFGMAIAAGDYPEVNPYVMYMILIFRNSLGDATLPDTTYWQQFLNTNSATAELMIVVAWIIYLINMFFLMIVMLNFLIAIVSQSYEEVMSKVIIS